MRCSMCGNDVVSTQHTCHVCNTVLIIEGLEKRFGFLARHEERWKKPAKFWERVKWMLIRPSHAMWDIVHKPNDAGGAFAVFSNMLIFGLVGIVLFNKAGAASLYSSTDPLLFLHGLGMYAMFVAVGFVYFVILWGFIILAQTIAAKFILNITPRWGPQLRIMYWTLVPALLCTGVYVLILAMGLPQLAGTTDVSTLMTQATGLFFSGRSLPVWIAADVVQIVFYFGYLTLLFTIAFREYYDKSTVKALFSAVVASVISAVVFVTTRTTFF